MKRLLALFTVGVLWCISCDAQDTAPLYRAFVKPPDDARVMVRWWWFGSSVTKAELDREMRAMKEGGFGGFEVQATYPLALDDPSQNLKNLPYLSDGFLDALRFTSEKARDYGLRLDLTLGSGWPYGGPQVPVTEAAGSLRWERVAVKPDSRRVPLPAMTEGEKLIAAFAGGTDRRLTDIRDGVLHLPEGQEQAKEVWFFISSRTGMMVKRPAVGAEGFVLDHYDKAAIDDYLRNVGDRLMQAFAANPPYAVFCDSLEVYGSDWTGDFLSEFRKRRGYDLVPHLPELVSDMGSKTAAVRYDWARTLTELLNERFIAPLQEWAKAHHTLLRMQVYGMPPAILSSSSRVDLPEGEGAQWRNLSATRWASSASHLYGRTVTSSETWTWLHSPVFRATPLDLKAEANLHFLEGINQLIGHGFPYTSEGIADPGWRFYAACVLDDKNPWWIVMPDVTRYLQRSSFMLRQGKPINDVAVYLPAADAYSALRPGQVDLFKTLSARIGSEVVGQILNAGFGLDFFDDESLNLAGKVAGGALDLGPNRYKIVLLPGVQSIPPATLRKLEEFAKNGGILIATGGMPSSAPGLLATAQEREEVRETAARLFEGSPAKGHLVSENDLAHQLRSLATPDAATTPLMPEIGFVHRRTDSADIYFVANTGNVRKSGTMAFRASGIPPEWWDAMDGQSSPANVVESGKETTTVSLDLAPYEAKFLVFARGTKAAKPANSSPNRSTGASLDVSTGWKVSFGSNGPTETMEKLHSWTDDAATLYYSGTATYEKQVQIPSAMTGEGKRLMLSFGEGTPIPEVQRRNGMQAWLDGPVREAAVVYVNGKKAGSVWSPPYELDISAYVKPGANEFRIVVANLALNSMAGRSLPDHRLLDLRYGKRFDAQDMNEVKPIPSGLLGPVRLIPEASGSH
jgi:alpha-L-rhamnosidase